MILSGLFALSVFLANVKGTDSPSDISCKWVCEIDTDIPAANVSNQHWKTVLSKTGQMKAIFPLHKRVGKDCVKFTSTENSSSFIEVWIFTPVSTQQRKFGFLSFAIFNFLENVLPFRYLFDGKFTEHEVDKISTEISCVLRPTSNESKRLGANGLDELYSPYFYIRELANFSQNRSILSLIWTEDFSLATAGFIDPYETSQTVSPEDNDYRLQFEQYIVLSTLGHLVCMFFTFYIGHFFLMLFRTNISTVEIAETVIAPAIHPEGETEPGDNSAPEPTEQGRQEDQLTAPRQNSEPTEQGYPVDELKTQKQPDDYCNSLQPVMQGHQEDKCKPPSDDAVRSLKDSNTDASPEHCGVGVDRPSTENSQTPDSHSNANPDENNLSPKRSGTHGSGCTRQKQTVLNIPPAVTERKGAVSSVDVGGLNHTAHSSTSGLLVQKGQQGAHNRDKKNFKSVRVIRVGEAPSSVGLRNFIANYLLRYKLVKLFFLLLFPIFPVILLDLFLLLPRLISRNALSLPSRSMTISALHFICEKSPGLLGFLVLYLFRCFCLCLWQSSANRVPSFLFRKHFWCFFLKCYIVQLLFYNNDFSACDECKETSSDCLDEWEFPVNIKHKSPLEILMKDWKDVFHHLFPKYCRRFFPEDESTRNSRSKRCRSGSCVFLSCLGFFLFYIILCALDFLLSCHTITVCYGRVWFTANRNQGKRCKQFMCLFIEFLSILSSIIWVVYLSVCCSVALEIAFASLVIICDKYPVQTFLQWAIYITFSHKVLSRYSSFTAKYDDLESMVFNMCTENHAKEIEQYRKGDVMNIPEDLLVSVRNKLIPLKDSVWELIQDSFWWVLAYIIVLIIISTQSKQPYNMALSAIVTLLNVLLPFLLDILFNRGKKKDLKDRVLKENIKRYVAEYFKEKRD